MLGIGPVNGHFDRCIALFDEPFVESSTPGSAARAERVSPNVVRQLHAARLGDLAGLPRSKVRGAVPVLGAGLVCWPPTASFTPRVFCLAGCWLAFPVSGAGIQ